QGYGLDQIWLLLDRTVDRYLERKPVVVVAIQVDDCLDRTIFTFHGWPKPRLRIAGDALETENLPVPSLEEYLAHNPVGIRSYAWNYLVYGQRAGPEAFTRWVQGQRAADERKQVLARRILEQMVDSLERR